MHRLSVPLRSLTFACLLCGFLFPALPPATRAQARGVVIEPGTEISFDKDIIHSAASLRKAGKLLDQGKVKAMLASPQPAALSLPAKAKKALSPREVYQRARAAFVRLGWLYKCPDCKEWHLNLAAGYAIAEGGAVATAAHNLTPDEEMKQAFMVAVTADGKAMPVTAILAVDTNLDAGIVRVEGFKGQPLGLNDDVEPGDTAFCFSDPLDIRGYFSIGSVNRFYWEDADDGDTATLDGIAKLRINVSTDWAPGSSGAAVLDTAGNAIGHVSAIAPVSDAPGEATNVTDKVSETKTNAAYSPDDAPMFQMHDAVPARGVLLLVQKMQIQASAKKHSLSK